MSCLFCKIANKEIQAEIVYEDDQIMAFKDISPQAPVHLLIVPRVHIATLNDTLEAHQALLGHMVLTARQLAKQFHIDEAGYRLNFNCNEDGGQTVFHIHLHLLGGRVMLWPPG